MEHSSLEYLIVLMILSRPVTGKDDLFWKNKDELPGIL